MKATKRQLQWRYARRRYWQRQKVDFTALGLTTRGTERKYQLHPELHAARRGRTEHWRRKMRQRINRAVNFVAVCRQTPVEKIYREFRARLTAPLHVEDIGWERWRLEK